ncbi:MAG TPA: hypothetical protein VFT40_01765 [Sphingomicrobium sp.]|nr:hypothetical protein [Sphingomicrobium sp.]
MNDAAPIQPQTSSDTRLSTEDAIAVMELLKGSNSVELKLMVEDPARVTIRHLGFDPVEAQPRQVYFFDTPDLALNKAGVIVRARRRPGGRGDTVVKLRPVDPATLSDELRRDEAVKTEVDVMPGGYVCSTSVKGRCDSAEVVDVCSGKKPLSSIFTHKQRDFYAAHAPAGISMDELVPLGPTFLLLAKQQPKHFDRVVVVELWMYPDGSRVLEISTKGAPGEAFQLAANFRALLMDSGIPIERSSSAKTGSALSFFSKQLKPEVARRPGNWKARKAMPVA